MTKTRSQLTLLLSLFVFGCLNQVSGFDDIVWAALDYSDAYDRTSQHYGNCGSGPVDAQSTSDQICIQRDGATCNVGWTQSGEYLEYTFAIDEPDDYDIWIRAAANRDGRRVRLELSPDPSNVEGSTTFNVRGDGWQSFHDDVWDLLYLQPGDYTLRVVFLTGSTNLCSVAVKPSTSRYDLHAPGTFGALMYYDYTEKSSERFGNCPHTRFGGGVSFDGVDSQYTKDDICCQAIRDTDDCCNVGWTESGEALFYSFILDGNHDHVDFSFRAASARAHRRVKVTVSPRYNVEESRTFTTPGNGYQEFETMEWNNIDIGEDNTRIEVWIEFLDGYVNLCSVGVEYS